MKDSGTDVYAALPITPPPFIAYEQTPWNQSDGIFKIVYSITDTLVNTYTNNEQYVLLMCNLQNCMDKIIGKLVTECDADKLEEYKTILDQLEILKYGIKSAFACKNFTRAETLLTNALTICTTFSGCDCDCDCNC